MRPGVAEDIRQQNRVVLLRRCGVWLRPQSWTTWENRSGDTGLGGVLLLDRGDWVQQGPQRANVNPSATHVGLPTAPASTSSAPLRRPERLPIKNGAGQQEPTRPTQLGLGDDQRIRGTRTEWNHEQETGQASGASTEPSPLTSGL